MCLIIYSPHAKLPARDDFRSAAQDNPDGIGVMSSDGIAKFNGRKSCRRAFGYVSDLARRSIPFGVHFRWATHGAIGRALTHPFEVPGTGDYLMHNGVLSTAKYATDDESDTLIFAREWMPYYSDRFIYRDDWKREVESDTLGSKLLVMDAGGDSFDLIHEKMGDWCDGLWYSNTYSLVSAATRAIQWLPSYKLATPAKADKAAKSDKSASVLLGDALKTLSARERKATRRFDWHDVSTWDLYPPTRRRAALNRFGDEDGRPLDYAVDYADEHAVYVLGQDDDEQDDPLAGYDPTRDIYS